MVAPDAERSAVGHAITTLLPLRVTEVKGDGMPGYAVSGMPADCVKLGIGAILEERPDIVVSGINLGPNTAASIIYSGTVSAATEARILGVLSVAVSLATFTEADFGPAAVVARQIAALVLRRGLPERVLLNVNVPNLPREKLAGLRVTRQGRSVFQEEFAVREDPRRQPYYWLAGRFLMTDEEEDTDAWAVGHGYVSVTPVTFDLTDYGSMADLAAWPWDRARPRAQTVPKRRSPKSPRPGTM